jgi:hypothetical protein
MTFDENRFSQCEASFERAILRFKIDICFFKEKQGKYIKRYNHGILTEGEG